MPDVYDKQIERLTRNPDQIVYEYEQAVGFFGFLEPTEETGRCGCPVTIKRGYSVCGVPEIIPIIRESTLPSFDSDLRVEHLGEFARIRRIYDAMLVEQESKEPVYVG